MLKNVASIQIQNIVTFDPDWFFLNNISLALDFQTFRKNMKISSSLSKFSETRMNVFKSNSRIIKNKKYYEISTIYTNASNTPFKINFNLMMFEFWVTSILVAGQIWIKFIFLPVSSEDNCPLHIETMMPLPLVIYLWLCDVEMQASFCEQTKFYVFAEWTNFSKEL